MPAEKFWDSETAIEGDGSEPVLTVTWGDGGTRINGVKFDQSAIDRLTNALRRATGKDRTVTVTLRAETSEYIAEMARAKQATKELAEELRAAGVDNSRVGEAIITTLKLGNSE